jgi:hypothetical protein
LHARPALFTIELRSIQIGENVASQVMDASTYPISEATARLLGRPLFGRASGRTSIVAADRVVVVRERRPRVAPDCAAPCVLAIGDAVVPRRVAHAIAEGRAAGAHIAAAVQADVTAIPR